MKSNLKFLAIAAISATTIFSSCNNDDETNNPTVTPPVTGTGVLGAQLASEGSFYSSYKGQVYSTSDSANFATNLVDMSFGAIGSGSTQPMLISLASRRAQGLGKVTTVTRATTFASSTLTKAQFDTASVNFIKTMPAAGTGAIVIETGKVYSFNNPEGKKGLVYITTISGTGTSATASISTRLQN